MFVAGYGPLWAKRTSPPVPITVFQTITFSDLPEQTVLSNQYNQYGFTGFTSYAWSDYSATLPNYPLVKTYGGSGNPGIVDLNGPPTTGLNNWMDNSDFGNEIVMNFDQSTYVLQSMQFDIAQNSSTLQVQLLNSLGNVLAPVTISGNWQMDWEYNSDINFLLPNTFSAIRFRGGSDKRMLIGNIRMSYLYYV